MRINMGLAAALAGAALTLAGCRDQGPDGRIVPELYVLESIGGQHLPLRLSDPGTEGAFVTIHSGRIRLVRGAEDGAAPGAERLRLETLAEVVRRGADGDERVVAHGESNEAYFFDRVGNTFFPYRIQHGDRTDAPFHLEARGNALVMHSDQDALRNWRFIR